MFLTVQLADKDCDSRVSILIAGIELIKILTTKEVEPPGSVLQKRCSLKFRKIRRKTPVLKSFF